jgi:hypothetical protein
MSAGHHDGELPNVCGQGGDLRRCWCSRQRALRIGRRTITTDDLHPGTRSQPISDHNGVTTGTDAYVAAGSDAYNATASALNSSE